MSLSIQLMTTFKPSLGIQSNLVVGVGGFISNFPPWNYCMGATNVVSAMSAMYAQRCQRSRPCIFLQCTMCVHAAYQSMHIHFELVRVKSMRLIHWFNTHELKMDMFWILSSCVLNQWRSIHWFNTHELKMDMFWICLKSWRHDFAIWICGFHGGNILCHVINSWPISALGFIHEGYNGIYGLWGSFHCAIFWGAQPRRK